MIDQDQMYVVTAYPKLYGPADSQVATTLGAGLASLLAPLCGPDAPLMSMCNDGCCFNYDGVGDYRAYIFKASPDYGVGYWQEKHTKEALSMAPALDEALLTQTGDMN